MRMHAGISPAAGRIARTSGAKPQIRPALATTRWVASWSGHPHKTPATRVLVGVGVVASDSWLGLGAVCLSIPPILKVARAAGFETRRWRESDFGPTQITGDSD